MQLFPCCVQKGSLPKQLFPSCVLKGVFTSFTTTAVPQLCNNGGVCPNSCGSCWVPKWVFAPTGSKLVNGVSGVLQGRVLGMLVFLLYTSELFSILENKLIGYANDSTVMAVVPSPGIRITEGESLICDLGRVSEWCDLWGMKLNANKTKTMIVSRSCTMHPQSPLLTIGRTVLKESDDLVILGVSFDSNMTFEKHLHSVSRTASRRLGILRKSCRVFHDRSLLG